MINKKLATTLLAVIICLSFLSMVTPIAQATTYYQYQIFGPILQGTGDAIGNSATVSVIIYNANGTTLYPILMSAGNAIFNFVSTTQVTALTWNFSSALNYTATYIFNPAITSFQLVKVTTINPNIPTYQYLFPLTDFTGMTNAYISVQDPLYGVVESQLPVDNIAAPAFFLQMYKTYNLIITADQGTTTQTFTAGQVISNNVQILAGAFPTNTSASATTKASRASDTSVTFSYQNPNSTSAWTDVQVFHYVGASQTTDYDFNYTVTPNSVSSTIAVADASKDYYVKIIAFENGANKTWVIPCSSIMIGTNPFIGKLDYLGNWPLGVHPEQLVALFFIMLFLAIGSFKSTGASCIFACIAAGVFIIMGWYTLSIPLLALAFILGMLVYMAERKEETGR